MKDILGTLIVLLVIISSFAVHFDLIGPTAKFVTIASPLGFGPNEDSWLDLLGLITFTSNHGFLVGETIDVSIEAFSIRLDKADIGERDMLRFTFRWDIDSESVSRDYEGGTSIMSDPTREGSNRIEFTLKKTSDLTSTPHLEEGQSSGTEQFNSIRHLSLFETAQLPWGYWRGHDVSYVHPFLKSNVTFNTPGLKSYYLQIEAFDSKDKEVKAVKVFDQKIERYLNIGPAHIRIQTMISKASFWIGLNALFLTILVGLPSLIGIGRGMSEKTRKFAKDIGKTLASLKDK